MPTMAPSSQEEEPSDTPASPMLATPSPSVEALDSDSHLEPLATDSHLDTVEPLEPVDTESLALEDSDFQV